MVTQAPKDMTAEEIEQLLLAQDDELAEGQTLQNDHGGEFTATVTKLHDPDMDFVYDTRTGIRSEFKVYEGNNSLTKMLAKRRSDGTPIYTKTKPENPPDAIEPDTPCLFQKQHPRYEEMKALGMPPCKRPGPLVGVGGAEFHARHAHPNQLELVKIHDDRVREDEARELQRQQTAAMLTLAGGGAATPPVVSPPGKQATTATTGTAETIVADASGVLKCSCHDAEFTNKGAYERHIAEQ